MPLLDLQSNLPVSSFPKEFLQRFADLGVSCLGEPEGKPEDSRMHVVVHPGLTMMIKGSCAPCVVVSIWGILGTTDSAEKNKEHSAKIFSFLKRELNLNEDRIGIVFTALELHQVGKRGTVLSFEV